MLNNPSQVVPPSAGPKPKIDQAKRRMIAIAGPVAVTFSHTCTALGRNQQQVGTELVDAWNRRNARRAKRALLARAASLTGEVPPADLTD